MKSEKKHTSTLYLDLNSRMFLEMHELSARCARKTITRSGHSPDPNPSTKLKACSLHHFSWDPMKRCIQSFTISSRKELFYRGGSVLFNQSYVGKIDCCSSQRRPTHNGSLSPPRRDSPLIYGDARGSGRWKDLPRLRIFSRLSSATVEDASGEKDVDGEPSEIHCSQLIGMRPATAPASTPLDLGCKAYYMARTIDLKTLRSRLYAGFPHRFEKHCVVIGPVDPNCFDGGYPPPRDHREGLGQVLRDLSKRNGPKGTKPRKGTIPERRPFVAPSQFSVEDSEYQPRAWDMWEPAGGLNGEKPAFFTKGGMKDIGNSYVVIFDYGSVVFLHFNETQQEEHLRRQRDFLYDEDKIPPVNVKTETHGLVLWSTLPEPARLEPDCTTLRELDVNHITIIGTVLGQTVALDHYGDLVDSMMAKFASINSGVEKTGKFTAAQKKELFQLVARNNTVRTDVISKLGILERSEAAWKHQNYNYVWEGLREEFEMDSRLRKIESKLSMLQQNTNFFIEMLHNQKSTMLEWTIIVLIGAEIVVGVCDLLNFKPFSS